MCFTSDDSPSTTIYTITTTPGAYKKLTASSISSSSSGCPLPFFFTAATRKKINSSSLEAAAADSEAYQSFRSDIINTSMCTPIFEYNTTKLEMYSLSSKKLKVAIESAFGFSFFYH